MGEMVLPDAMQWIDAYNSGRDNRMTRDREEGRKAIGGFMATGDYAGAARAAYGMGDVTTGLDLQGRGLRQTVGTQFNTDPNGAVQAATGAGDFELAADARAALDQMDAQQLRDAHRRTEGFARLAMEVDDLPYDQRRDAINRMMPRLQEYGVTPDQLADYDPTDESLQEVIRSSMGLTDLMGTISSEKFGDDLRTIRTTPFGREVVGRPEPIPVTRAETFDRAQFEEENRRNKVNEEQENARIGIARQNANSGGGGASVDTSAAILARLENKILQGGIESLTANELQIYNDRRRSGGGGLFDNVGGDYGDEYDAPSTPPAPSMTSPRVPAPGSAAQPGLGPGVTSSGRAAPRTAAPNPIAGLAGDGTGRSAGARQNPYRPTNQASFDRLAPGSWFINPADGRILQKDR